MISAARVSAGRTASRLARQQQRHVVGPAARIALVRAEAIGLEGSSIRLNSPASRALVSVAKPPKKKLAEGRTMSATAVAPKPLVTMIPWVPPPFQPLMDRLHPIMIRERRPMAWCGIEALNTVTNAGALCGHFSFALLTLAYLETDVLKLR